jgi:DNA mismatch endonuclease (patch repair protein)
MGLRFRKNVETMPGKPDLVFSGARVVVFCDGDFWHGREWPFLRERLEQRANASYWIAKIESNIQRDQRHTAQLEEAGWHVIRLWETDIKRDVSAAAERVGDIVKTRQRRS